MRTDDVSGTVEVEAGLFLAQLSGGDEMSVQHARVEPGAEVPEHSHHHEQAGFVYEGSLTFRVDGEEVVVSAGESYAIPGDEPHSAVNEGETAAKVIDVFSPPRPDPDWA